MNSGHSAPAALLYGSVCSGIEAVLGWTAPPASCAKVQGVPTLNPGAARDRV